MSSTAAVWRGSHRHPTTAEAVVTPLRGSGRRTEDRHTAGADNAHSPLILSGQRARGELRRTRAGVGVYRMLDTESAGKSRRGRIRRFSGDAGAVQLTEKARIRQTFVRRLRQRDAPSRRGSNTIRELR